MTAELVVHTRGLVKRFGSAVTAVDEVLPNAAANTVINLGGNPSLALYGSNFPIAQVALTRRRDIVSRALTPLLGC